MNPASCATVKARLAVANADIFRSVSLKKSRSASTAGIQGFDMLKLYRRHIQTCKHYDSDKGREHRNCSCTIWAQGTLGDKPVRESLKLTSWEGGNKRVQQWEAHGRQATRHKDVSEAWKAFIQDAEAGHLSESVVRNMNCCPVRWRISGAGHTGSDKLKRLSRPCSHSARALTILLFLTSPLVFRGCSSYQSERLSKIEFVYENIP
jgi:hypothetical protein